MAQGAGTGADASAEGRRSARSGRLHGWRPDWNPAHRPEAAVAAVGCLVCSAERTEQAQWGNLFAEELAPALWAWKTFGFGYFWQRHVPFQVGWVASLDWKLCVCVTQKTSWCCLRRFVFWVYSLTKLKDISVINLFIHGCFQMLCYHSLEVIWHFVVTNSVEPFTTFTWLTHWMNGHIKTFNNQLYTYFAHQLWHKLIMWFLIMMLSTCGFLGHVCKRSSCSFHTCNLYEHNLPFWFPKPVALLTFSVTFSLSEHEFIFEAHVFPLVKPN